MSAAEMRELCDKRGGQAGVQPFAPNDLARSGLLSSDAARRRERGNARVNPMAKISPLYEDQREAETEEEQIAARIHFPYRARPSL
jgi:hypothetical protein